MNGRYHGGRVGYGLGGGGGVLSIESWLKCVVGKSFESNFEESSCSGGIEQRSQQSWHLTK